MKSNLYLHCFTLLTMFCNPYHFNIHDINIQRPNTEYDLDVDLAGVNSYGHISYKQNSESQKIATLDTHVYKLKPHHIYRLESAFDSTVNTICESKNWLILGRGEKPQQIITNDRGEGSATFIRKLTLFPHGKKFDIHFQVIDQENLAVVLSSKCYQFTVK